jgi:hypothetical protein
VALLATIALDLISIDDWSYHLFDDVAACITFTPHVGRQNVENVSNASYADYSVTFNKEFSGVVLGLSLVTTDASESFYVPGPAVKSNQSLGKLGVVLTAKYNFKGSCQRRRHRMALCQTLSEKQALNFTLWSIAF